MPGSTGVISDLGNATATCISSTARAPKVERSRNKDLKPVAQGASLRPNVMVPSDRRGEFPDWKAIEIIKATRWSPF